MRPNTFVLKADGEVGSVAEQLSELGLRDEGAELINQWTEPRMKMPNPKWWASNRLMSESQVGNPSTAMQSVKRRFA